MSKKGGSKSCVAALFTINLALGLKNACIFKFSNMLITNNLWCGLKILYPYIAQSGSKNGRDMRQNDLCLAAYRIVICHKMQSDMCAPTVFEQKNIKKKAIF